MTRPTTTGKAQDLITFTRSTTGTYLDSVTYGDELVTNGTFDNNIDGWTSVNANLSASNGGMLIADNGSFSVAYQAVSTVIGKTYIIYVDAIDVPQLLTFNFGQGQAAPTGSNAYFDGTGEIINNLTVVGSFQHIFTAVATTTYISFGTNSINAITIDNVSVKELTSGQGAQGTPLLRTSAINEARIEYDASGNCLGLLVEEARTNLFRYSQELSNVSHALITTDNATVSPDGTQNASLCIPTSANVEHFIDDQTVTVGTDYAMSCFAKYGSGSYLLAFRGSGIGANPPQFNLQTGTVVNEGVSSVWSNTKIEDVGNGWYKCSSVGNPNTATPLRFQFMRSDSLAPSFTGDGTGHYIWGIQVEQGSFPTSYIPTSGSTVTRSADAASLAVSEFGYNQDQGTVVVEAQRFGTNNYPRTVMIDNGSESESISLGAWGQSTTVVGYVVSSGAVQASVSTGGALANNFKHSLAYKKDDFGSSRDGGAVVTDTSGVIPATPTTLRLGRNSQVAQFLNGHIKSVQYYPLRLSNAQLQALTV